MAKIPTCFAKSTSAVLHPILNLQCLTLWMRQRFGYKQRDRDATPSHITARSRTRYENICCETYNSDFFLSGSKKTVAFGRAFLSRNNFRWAAMQPALMPVVILSIRTADISAFVYISTRRGT